MQKVKNVLKQLGVFLFAMLVIPFGVGMTASADTTDYISIDGYVEGIDYSLEIQKCIADGSPYALQMGAIYERQRNYKIDVLQLPFAKTNYFSSIGSTDGNGVAVCIGEVSVTGFDSEFDYSLAIDRCIKDGSQYAFQMGAIYEKQRNLKIQTLKMPFAERHWFDGATCIADVVANKQKEANASKWSDADRNLLYYLVMCECGADWVPDWVQRMTCSVVINRVNSTVYPNTVYNVIYQPGQYNPWNLYNNAPTAKVKRNVDYVLEHGTNCPANVYGQSGCPSGSGVHATYYDEVLGTTIYFSYG